MPINAARWNTHSQPATAFDTEPPSAISPGTISMCFRVSAEHLFEIRPASIGIVMDIGPDLETLAHEELAKVAANETCRAVTKTRFAILGSLLIYPQSSDLYFAERHVRGSRETRLLYFLRLFRFFRHLGVLPPIACARGLRKRAGPLPSPPTFRPRLRADTMFAHQNPQ